MKEFIKDNLMELLVVAVMVITCITGTYYTRIVENEYKSLLTKYNTVVEDKKTIQKMYSILVGQEPYIVHEVKTVECIGEFKITYYCGCDICNGEWGNITYRGTIPRPQHTIAVDPNVIPLDSKVIIDGIEYTAEDTGNKIIGNKINIYVSSHEEALEKGTETLKVYKEVN